MKANHNLFFVINNLYEFLSICQRYNMKANHNSADKGVLYGGVFINMSKIQYESKSQPIVDF
ncbi:MAG: hypothetical protein U0V03_02235 [Bacteroidia bacterium]